MQLKNGKSDVRRYEVGLGAVGLVFHSDDSEELYIGHETQESEMELHFVEMSQVFEQVQADF